jgi:hypothetical protein
MKGTFKTKDRVDAFTGPLKTLGSLIDEGIVIRFSKIDDKVHCKVESINPSKGTVVKTKYIGVFDDFQTESDEVKIGVLKVNDFVALFGLFSDEVEFNYNEEDKRLTLSSGSSSVSYQTADPDLIKEFNKPFPGKDWYTTFNYGSEFASFNKGMSVLANEECIVIDGDPSTAQVNLTVKNRGLSINSYSTKVKAEVSEPFEIAFKKEVMQIVLGSKYETMKLSVCSTAIMAESISKTSETTFFVAKLSAAK